MLGRRKKSSNANANVIALSSGVSAEEKEETDEIERILGAKDLYDVLGVQYTPHWDSQEEAVREAYLDRSRLLNPSQNTDSRLGQAASRLAEAYDTLCDDELRTKYNLANGFEQPEPFGGLLGLLATAFGVNPNQQGRRNNMPPPNQGPRTTPEERRVRIQEQQRELEERHEEQQRNIRQQEEQLARMRRQHQSGGLRAERSTEPQRGSGSGQQPRQQPRTQRQGEPRFPASYRRQYGGGFGASLGGQRQGQGTRREGQGLGTGGQGISLDAIEARMRELMEALAGEAQGQSAGQGLNRQQRRQQQDEDYTEELDALRNMGFSNEQQNLHALRQARGSVELAIEFLLDS